MSKSCNRKTHFGLSQAACCLNVLIKYGSISPLQDAVALLASEGHHKIRHALESCQHRLPICKTFIQALKMVLLGDCTWSPVLYM